MADEQWWHDPDLLKERVEECGGFAAASRRYGGVASTLKSAWLRFDYVPFVRQQTAEKPGKRVGTKEAIVTAQVGESDVDEIVTRAGLSLDEWVVERTVLNEWEAMSRDETGKPVVTKLHQLKVFLKKRVDLSWVFPAVEVTERRKPHLGTSVGGSRLVWLGGDEQAPYNDAKLEEALLRWLADVRPDEMVGLGDIMDFPTISRHGDRPSWAASAQDCINAAYRIMSNRRDVAPDARYRIVRGNHDWRIESELLSRAERMFGIRPADIAGVDPVAALSIRRLLHLDALQVELVGVEGDKWEMARVPVAPGLVAQHRLSKGPRVRSSVVAGDSHRQSLKQVTEWEEGEMVTRTFVEAGCMCNPLGGLGYAVDPDWQQGFVTAAVAADGSIGFDLGVWRDGKLTWRGEVW